MSSGGCKLGDLLNVYKVLLQDCYLKVLLFIFLSERWFPEVYVSGIPCPVQKTVYFKFSFFSL